MNQSVRTDAVHGVFPAEEACSLFANISHEIRTPVNGVLGTLALLLDTGLTDEQRTLTTMAQNSAESLFALTNDILDVCMMQAGTLTLKQRPIDLQQLLRTIAVCHNTTAQAKKLELKVNLPATILHAPIGDVHRLRQLAAGVIGRAIAEATHGCVVIDVGLAMNADHSCRLRVTADCARGEAADTTAPHKYGRADLEWRLCRQLAYLMKAEIGAQQTDGGRSKFWCALEMPCAPSPLTDIRILFVEEQADKRRAMQEQLMQLCARATGLDTAAAALNALEQAAADGDPYLIAILDQQMQNIDGETFGTAIGADPRYRDTLLVLLSDADSADAQHFAQVGFSAFLSKPVPQQTLLDALFVLGRAIVHDTPAPFVTSATFAAPQPEPAQDGAPFAGYRVLVADDNIVNQQVASRMLQKLGCETATAINGREAVAMHRAEHYDLVLMDCQMPELDGFQAAAQIREIEAKQRHTPIIAWTAHALPAEQEKSVLAGMDDFMAKPIRPQVLRDKLTQWLRREYGANLEPQAPEQEEDELESILEMFGEDFSELAALFQNDSPKRLAALWAAAQDNETTKVASIAHTLAGSSASIGATRMAALCKQLEIAVKAGPLSDIESRLKAIEKAYAGIDTRLRSMIPASAG